MIVAERKVFCENCRADVEYTVEEKDLIGKIRGEEYHYVGKEARCIHCNSAVDVDDISAENLKSLYDVYRKTHGIVSLEKIQAIPDKYAIGKRPLSILLGWGEHTFTRYYYGDMPTRQYSEILMRLFDDPSYYLEILETNKERLTSEQSYLKSRKAVDQLIKKEMESGEKIDYVVGYVLNQCEDITPLALQKTLYYVQGFFYAFFGRFMFPDDCQAWAHGPVYRNIYARYADYRFDPISRVEAFDSSVFSTQEKAVLDSVIKNICCYSGKTLETFTHNESPWLDTRGDIPSGAPSEKIIEKNMIVDYFLLIKKKYEMNTPQDIRFYTKEMFANL